MVNAWSLAASVLDGTLDEDYPIMNTKKSHSYYDKDGGLHMRQDEIKIDTSDEQVVNVPSDINLDNYEHSEYWYDYNRNDLDRPDPFVDAFDHMMEGRPNLGEDDTNYDVDGYPLEFTTLSDNDDSIAHHVDSLTLNTEGQIKETMSDSRNKYHEKEILKDIEEYVSRTYNGHYTGTKHEYRNVQTIDLMASRDLASDFCQANILKYGSRYGSKDGRNKKDLLKVIHYAMLLLHFDEHYGKPSMTSGNIDHNMP